MVSHYQQSKGGALKMVSHYQQSKGGTLKFGEGNSSPIFVGGVRMEFESFKFYEVDPSYLAYIHSYDSEVYYNPSYHISKKPFLGIVVKIENYKYFIPLSSAKEKHKKWKNVADSHFLIYEIISNAISIDKDIYKPFSDTENMHILAVLDIKKMIPVPDGSYSPIEFDLLEARYRDLFLKEYAFCLSVKDKILKKVKKIYLQQKRTNKIHTAYCNFSLCEEALEKWSETHKS